MELNIKMKWFTNNLPKDRNKKFLAKIKKRDYYLNSKKNSSFAILIYAFDNEYREYNNKYSIYYPASDILAWTTFEELEKDIEDC